MCTCNFPMWLKQKKGFFTREMGFLTDSEKILGFTDLQVVQTIASNCLILVEKKALKNVQQLANLHSLLLVILSL